MRGNQIKPLTPETVSELVASPEQALALQVTVAVLQHLTEQITCVERAVHARVKLRPARVPPGALAPFSGQGPDLG